MKTEEGVCLKIFDAVRIPLRVLVFGSCLFVLLKAGKDNLRFNEVEFAPKQTAIKQTPPVTYQNVDVKILDSSFQKISHVVDLDKKVMLFYFYEGYGIFDIAFILKVSFPYNTNGEVVCNDGLVIVELHNGEKPVRESLLLYGQETRFVWSKVEVKSGFKVNISFKPLNINAKSKAVCEKTLITGDLGMSLKK